MVVGIAVAIAAVHLFRLGTILRGAWRQGYYAYASDVMLPFGTYFLLCQAAIRNPFLRDWRVRALVVLGVSSFAELMQSLGVPLLGSTYDPLDFAMYGAGVLLAVVADRIVLARWLPGWSAPNPGGP